MRANIDAIKTAEAIKSTYRRYLQSLLSVRDEKLDRAVRKAIADTEMLDKGPYLEATPPYAPGASLRDLVADGTLDKGFAQLASNALPFDRALYMHQEQSIRKVTAGRNVVVATGTGSGKTESFLLPILNSLIREKENGTLGPGVRALLLYPMNALANDQLKRLRQLLAEYPDITFGRYTGDTEDNPAKARELFGQLNIGEPQIKNELMSREEMRETPPNILLTNYAMLEYLLLRPQDNSLFSNDENTWRFIVVDEAHVYDGSQGAEIAMLLRRVKDRVSPERSIQCIATSATVGSESKPSDVTKFASNLFGQPFEWSDTDTSKQDIITAKRVETNISSSWGPLSATDYINIVASDNPESALLAIAKNKGFAALDGYEAVTNEASFIKTHSLLGKAPLSVHGVASSVFGGQSNSLQGIAALISLASALHSPDGSPAISARYHLFLRATEGAYTCFSSKGPHVKFARHDTCPDCNASMFELGSCTKCGAVHVVGHLVNNKGRSHFTPRKSLGTNTWLVFTDNEALIDEDEETTGESDFVLGSDEAKLCVQCNALVDKKETSCPECETASLKTVRRLNKKGDDIAGCLVCSARGAATVRVFETGSDAAGAVIATSLYQNLPVTDVSNSDSPGGGRKLLAFSDSRQSAAYFAPYLDRSYGKIQRRRLIAQALSKSLSEEGPIMVEDLVFNTKSAADAVNYFPARKSAQQKARDIAPWIMAEAMSIDDRLSLEGLGLLYIGMDKPTTWKAPEPLLKLGLSEDESWSLLQELIRSLRLQGAVTLPENIDAKDEIFQPRLGPFYVRGEGSDQKLKVLSWIPTRGTNKRLDYLTRVIKTLGGDEAEALDILKGIWRYLTSDTTEIDWLKATTAQRLGVVYQIDHELLRFSWTTQEDDGLYQCSLCRRIYTNSVRGVCPATLGCEGSLEKILLTSDEKDNDHYRTIYRSMKPVSLTAQEHTAQWTNVEAASIQNKFITGEVNVLSCSTTFELGVDVGELQAVFLRNMPPSTANYIQRAGRAGRRSGTAALVVTYANRRSHDLSIYDKPETAMSGAMRAPYVPYENIRIDRRHAHSIVMSEFFRWYLDNYSLIPRTAADFFLPESPESFVPAIVLKEYLSSVPENVRDALKRVLPESVSKEIEVDSDGWVKLLLDLVENVRIELERDVDELEKLQHEAAADKKYGLADRFSKVVTNLKKRDLLGYLGSKNILPKYGFPTDSVDLRTTFSGDSAGSKIELSRDLTQAIYQYAPGSTVVAGGRLWTSRAIYRMPGRELEQYEYHICETCNGYWQSRTNISAECPHCHEVTSKKKRIATIPVYGFVADRKTADPGPRPPKSSWSGATYVGDLPEELHVKKISLPNGECVLSVGPRGRMVAIADGPGGSGFVVCEWCGYGASKMNHSGYLTEHENPLSGRDCTGPSASFDLAHSYETDICKLDIITSLSSKDRSAWLSVLYAVLEAASNELEIARSDIGGSLHPTSATSWSLVLFDRVPGGAGNVLLLEKNIELVLKAALRRVKFCECGEETSCYSCLRSYENQRDHELLVRGEAVSLLEGMVG